MCVRTNPREAVFEHKVPQVFYQCLCRDIPNLKILSPKDENELVSMLHSAIVWKCPVAIRYPRGSGVGVPVEKPQLLLYGKAEELRQGEKLCLWAIGSMVQTALQVADELQAEGMNVGVECFLNFVFGGSFCDAIGSKV